MRPEVRTFLSRTWTNILKLLGTTTLAIVLSLLFASVGFLIQLAIDLHQKWGAPVLPIVAAAFLSWPTAGSIGFAVLSWIYLWFRAAGQTISQDHLALQEQKRIAEAVPQPGSFPKPDLEIMIEEVIIHMTQPAHCFVRADIHNVSPGSEITIKEYKLCLSIAGRQFCSTDTQLIMGSYVGILQDEDEDNMPHLCKVGEFPLPDLRSKVTDGNPLKIGHPQNGWLHFVIQVPRWPVDKEIVGEEIHHTEEGEEYTVPEELETPHTRNIESAELFALDPFDIWHPSNNKALPKQGLFPWNKAVEERKS